ncbi:MAG: hypothetical protein KDD45_12115, partial [Bdellovibrionales bacterium]|nr:hypothetical protein [Bdellovibrionales bacterium]
IIYFFISHFLNISHEESKISLTEHSEYGWFFSKDLKNLKISPGNLKFIQNSPEFLDYVS